MEEDDPTCVARRRKVNHGGDNQARYCFPVFSCLRSARCNTICRTLSIVLFPGLILFGGITVFITGCLINIPPMIIGGAAMFVLGILFCLLCGHACDGLTKRVRKPRQSRDETKPVLVWFQLVWLFLSSLLDNWWHPLNGERVFQTQYLIRQPENCPLSGDCSRAAFNCSVLQRYVAADSPATQWSNFDAQVIQIVTTRKRQRQVLIRNILTRHSS